MKNIILVAMLGMLSACATGPSPYGPAAERASLGFTSQKIEHDRYRVMYTAKTPYEAQDYALLRAAQLTLEAGYSHFQVVGGHANNHSLSGSPISSSVGIGYGHGSGYYGHGSHTNVGVGININDVSRALNGERIHHTLEIRMLDHNPGGPRIYDASSVATSIKPSVFLG